MSLEKNCDEPNKRPKHIELLTVRELASRLKVSRAWVYERTYKKAKEKIPHIRLGALLRFNESEVISWLEAKGKTKF